MSQNLQLAVNIFWLTAVLGLGIWLFIRSVRRSDNRPKLILKWVLTGLVLLFVFEEVVPGFRGDDVSDMLDALMLMLICGGALAVIWRNSVADIFAKPVANLFDGGNEPPVPKPYYSVALTKRKLNKLLEAMVEVRQQLASFPNDFEGVMLLAGIQAEDLKDLPGAELTLDHFCDSPGAPPRCAMRCAACSDNSVSGNRAMIFSSAARAASASCVSLSCQSASWFIAAANCLCGASGRSQKWFNVITAPGKSRRFSA